MASIVTVLNISVCFVKLACVHLMREKPLCLHCKDSSLHACRHVAGYFCSLSRIGGIRIYLSVKLL